MGTGINVIKTLSTKTPFSLVSALGGEGRTSRFQFNYYLSLASKSNNENTANTCINNLNSTSHFS